MELELLLLIFFGISLVFGGGLYVAFQTYKSMSELDDV